MDKQEFEEDATDAGDWQSMLGGMSNSHNGQCPYPCPFCSGAELLKQVNPEVAGHLAAAGREFLLAAKSFMEALAEKDSSRKKEESLERIPFEK